MMATNQVPSANMAHKTLKLPISRAIGQKDRFAIFGRGTPKMDKNSRKET